MTDLEHHRCTLGPKLDNICAMKSSGRAEKPVSLRVLVSADPHLLQGLLPECRFRPGRIQHQVARKLQASTATHSSLPPSGFSTSMPRLRGSCHALRRVGECGFPHTRIENLTALLCGRERSRKTFPFLACGVMGDNILKGPVQTSG